QITLFIGILLMILNTLTPVIPVELGESTTLTCDLFNTDISNGEVHWYKQSVGDNLKLIVTQQKSLTPQSELKFFNSRWKVNNDENFSNLTILSTIQEDEGIYHCAVIEWFGSSKWSGTYLIIKGNNMRYFLISLCFCRFQPANQVHFRVIVL
uniref:Ig-like domain-containing protein n=1 Tax=Acanthochromis polyacanthus TaxID=80966 RepID=A0A3Q1ERN3_9TELE